jgi:hypothetical protein
MGREAAQCLHLCMAGQIEGWLPDSVHPSGDHLAIQDNHCANGKIAPAPRLLSQANGFSKKRKVIL